MRSAAQEHTEQTTLSQANKQVALTLTHKVTLAAGWGRTFGCKVQPVLLWKFFLCRMQLNNDCLLAVDFVLRVRLGGSGWYLLEWWTVRQELYILKVELLELSFKNIFLHLNIC